MLPFKKIRSKLLNTISIPEDLSALITYDPSDEVDPAEAGMTGDGVRKIWSCVEALYRTGISPGITFSLRRHGQVVLNRGIGHSHGNGPDDPPGTAKTLITPDTPICQYSASKAVTAMMIHLLAERGEIDLADPISRYIPEFGAHGKQGTTIHHIISHHGGIPAPPPGVDPEILFDNDGLIRLICGLKPASLGGSKIAYHAVTGGAILGEIVHRVTGATIREFLRETVQEPLGFRYFGYGVNEADIDKVAVNYQTGPPLLFPVSAIARRALSISWGDVVQIANNPRFLRAIVPAANLVATADEMSRFFQMMLNGGELNGVRVFDPQTIRRAVTATDRLWFDATMVVPMRYSAGLMLGYDPVGLWGPYTASAYGHIGFINIFCWADPSRQIAVSLQTTGKCLFGPHLLPLAKLLFAIGRHCRMEMDDFPEPSYRSYMMPLHKMLRKLLIDS